jgi:thiol:disulfide interchange protein
MKHTFKFLFAVFISLLVITTHPQTTVTTTKLDDTTTKITLNLDLNPGEFVYKEYLDVSVDTPGIELSDWESSTEPINHYDPTFNENKKAFKDKVTLTLTAKQTQSLNINANLHLAYYRTSHKAITQEVIPLELVTKPTAQPELGYAVAAQDATVTEQSPGKAPTPNKPAAPQQTLSWSEWITRLVQATQSLWLRLLLVFLLGMLVSLTPCIYPMIPITVGVLQAQGQTSVGRNFITALCYVMGIATTFALLGVMAAFTGQLFGTIMRNPLCILVIVALLIYLGLAMLGLYEMYVPRSLANNKSGVKKGSLLSAFMFGVVSGTVASPCLSPGLVLLLSLVTTIGSKIIGFALLFCFGLGLGLPLLIIGTFSSALNYLPRAGMWMVEIKKLFGFLLLGMCFYFLSALLPLCSVLWGLALFVSGCGVYYLYNAFKASAGTHWKPFKIVVGCALLASSVVVAAYAYKATCTRTSIAYTDFWKTDYETALAQAQQEKKKVFICFGAQFCSICTAIDKTVFKNQSVCQALAPCITIKLDGSDSKNNACTLLQKKYAIKGFPTYLLIDPTTDTLIKQWGSELYDVEHAKFAQELEGYLNP